MPHCDPSTIARKPRHLLVCKMQLLQHPTCPESSLLGEGTQTRGETYCTQLNNVSIILFPQQFCSGLFSVDEMLSTLVPAGWRQFHTKDMNSAKILIAGEAGVQRTKQSSIFIPESTERYEKPLVLVSLSVSGKRSQLLPPPRGDRFSGGDVICAPTPASPIRPAGR